MHTILVTGGTGTLGKHVVERLRSNGHTVRSVSRHPHPTDEDAFAVDLRNGTGLNTALEGVDTVVHCASAPTGGDIASATQLIRAARAAQVEHLVYISIVGCDRVPLGYYRTKHLVEEALLASSLGTTVLRATQFHDLVQGLCARLARLPVMPVPDVPIQPVDVEEVASRLAELAVGPPSERVPDMGGPQVETFEELARTYLESVGSNKRLWPVNPPGAIMAAARSGGLLAPDRAAGGRTFAEFMAGTSTIPAPR